MDDAAQLRTALADRYEVQKEIGRGGMATVYLARDVKHHRNVALKLLNPELGAVLGVERFLSEIRVTANLQHPNLLPLFDSGEANGLLFYVMPFIDGESLRARLDREKQLPVDEALRIGIAIAGALDYAHRHSVIHRDLKPENVLLHEGQPLVADFGIALAVSNAGGARVTQTGLSLGTPQYMSPEQATGDRAIDGRTDIYSLGAVVYEMLAGEPPHSGTTAQAIIARLLTDKPRPVRSSRSSVPEHVEWAIDHALEKLPADRFATAHDFAAALEGSPAALRSIQMASPSFAAGKATRHRRNFITGAAVAVAAIFGIAADRWLGGVPGDDRESVAFTMEAPDIDGVKGSFQAVNISPDGQTLGFTVIGDTSGRIFVRRLSDLAPHVLPGSDRVYDLFFSPDGKSIGFFTIDGVLRKVGVDGSNLVTLGSAPTFYSGGAWAKNQQIVLGDQGNARDLFQTTVGGGSLKPLTAGAKIDLARPVITPDGKTILYVEWGPGFTEDDFFGIADRATGKFTTSKVLIAAPIGVIDGHAIVSTSDGGIKALPFDARAQRVTGDAIQIEEAGTVLTQGYSGSSAGIAAMSANGTLAYLRGTNEGRLALSDSTASQSLGAGKRAFSSPVFSPDGRRIAVAVESQRGDTAVSDIFLFDLATHTLNRLTSRGDAILPTWTADGKSVVFGTWFEAKPSVWRQPIDGSTPERLVEVATGRGVIFGASPTPDGRGVVYVWNTFGNVAYDLFSVSATDRTPRKLVTGSKLSIYPAISPDGHWLAFAGGDDFVRTNIFVVPFDGRGARIQVSTDGGDLPTWSRDGNRLYYRHSGGLAVATLKRTGANIEVVGRPVAIFPKLQHLTEYDVAPDGKHVLSIMRDATDLRLVVVTKWAQRVRARIAEAKGGK